MFFFLNGGKCSDELDIRNNSKNFFATLFLTKNQCAYTGYSLQYMIVSVCRPYPDCCVHSSCGQPLDSSVGAVLEVQAVNRFLVVPCNLTRYQLHFIGSSNTTCADEREGLRLALQKNSEIPFPAVQRTHI